MDNNLAYYLESENENYVETLRITEHIHQVKDRRTFSMKLKARTNLHGNVLRVSWIPLDVVNYDMIAPAIESMLRDRINPILGRQ